LDFGWHRFKVRRLNLKKQKKEVDRGLLFLTLILTAIGIVAVADASAPQAVNVFGDKFYFAKQQLIWGVLGIITLFVVSKIHYNLWQKLAVPIFLVGVALLIVVLLPSVGTEALGARRWIILGPISVQPSEIIKFGLALYLAKLSVKSKSILAFFVPLILAAGLIMLQPDLGTTLIVGLIGMTQIFLSGINLFYFVGAAGLGVLASLILILTSSYRKARLLSFFEQTQDPLGRSYHIRQILLALGSGGLFGVGLGQSRQKFLFLPEAATDSVFAIIAEEVGFLGAMVLLFLFAFWVFKAFRVVRAAPDRFSQILSAGITAWIGGQTFLNIGSMVALVPLTGVPLPFISYGGSSLVMLLLASGILLNISRHVGSSK
jgi:cell division protein FtsW